MFSVYWDYETQSIREPEPHNDRQVQYSDKHWKAQGEVSSEILACTTGVSGGH